MKKLLLIEPFFTGSHADWANSFQRFSQHELELLYLSGHHWKWRMHGGAVTLARKFMEGSYEPDLILATDMLDLSTFLALTRKRTAGIPVVLYFHENQLSYPWSPNDPDPKKGRDLHYGFINYVSAMAADAIVFNSQFHLDSFLDSLPGFLQSFPDHHEKGSISMLAEKSSVLPLGLDLKRFDTNSTTSPTTDPPLILWNHRWEYDKNPDAFFNILFELQAEGIPFELAVMGESYGKKPPIFKQAHKQLADRIIHWGYVEDFNTYAQWLSRADILPVTSIHDFFGISVVQAIHCGCYPLLPNRLSYGEHIPKDLHAQFLYTDESNLKQKLKAYLLAYPSSSPVALREHVLQYDWNKIASVYDQFFLTIADK